MSEEAAAAGELDGPFLVHKLNITGKDKNRDGRLCLSGTITLVNAGIGKIAGRIESTHSSVTIRPRTFDGNGSKATFWIDEAQLPVLQEVFIVLRTREDERRIPISELRVSEESSLNWVNWDYAQYYLWLPALIGLVLFTPIFWWFAGATREVLEDALGSGWTGIWLEQDARGVLQLALAEAHWIGWAFLLLSWAVPLGVSELFKRYPPHLQESLQNHFLGALCSMSAVMAVCLALPIFRRPVTSDPELFSCNLPRLSPWFLVFNLLAATYFFLEHRGTLEGWFPNIYWRWAVAVTLWLVYLTGITLALSP